MDTIQTPEKVPYYKDCLGRLKEKKKVQVKLPYSNQIHLDNVNFENVFLKLKAKTFLNCPSGLLFSIILFIADIEIFLKTGLAELQYRNKAPVTQLRNKAYEDYT